MSQKFLGIIDDTVQFEKLQEITSHRSVGAIPFAGRYRLIDFPLTCFHHAGVTNVGIYTRGKFRSIQDHLGNGKSWDLNRKRDGLFFLPKMEASSCDSRILSFEHVHEHIEYLLKSKEEYVLITNPYVVTMFDYEELFKFHVDNKCDISEVYHNGQRLNIFVLPRKLLINLVLESATFGYKNMVEVIDLSHRYQVCNYEVSGYVTVIKSIDDYFNANMELLNNEVYNELFSPDRLIITKTSTSPSTHYLKGAITRNSIMANSIISAGVVENSIVFRSVEIGKNTHISNSIINQRCVIGENCVIHNAILDKECIIAPNVTIIGKDKIVYLKKHTKIANYNL